MAERAVLTVRANLAPPAAFACRAQAMAIDALARPKRSFVHAGVRTSDRGYAPLSASP